MASTFTFKHAVNERVSDSATQTAANGHGISLAPKPNFLLSLANRNWHVKTAISELVDNALGKLRGDAKHVKIIHDTTKRILTVFDDGNGMPHLVKAFRLGDSAGIGPEDIGRYGCGGTIAMIWLAYRVRIWTMQDDGRVMHD